MPAQPRDTRKITFEPDVDVERFNVATDSMARVVRRVRGEDPGPAPRPRRRRRRARVGGHPSASRPRGARTGSRSRSQVTTTLSPPPQRRASRGRVALLAAALTLAAIGALALAASPAPDEPAAEPPPTAAPPAAPPATPPAEQAEAPPEVVVRSPAPGRVEVTAPAPELVIESIGLCWLRVALDEEPGVDLLLDAGDREAFEAGARVELRIGNPGAVAVEVAGTAVDLGDHGGQPVDVVVTPG